MPIWGRGCWTTDLGDDDEMGICSCMKMKLGQKTMKDFLTYHIQVWFWCCFWGLSVFSIIPSIFTQGVYTLLGICAHAAALGGFHQGWFENWGLVVGGWCVFVSADEAFTLLSIAGALSKCLTLKSLSRAENRLIPCNSCKCALRRCYWHSRHCSLLSSGNMSVERNRGIRTAKNKINWSNNFFCDFADMNNNAVSSV